MATQIVMDHTGDTRRNFNADDEKALLKAEERFKSLTSDGFTAAVRDADGNAIVTKTFDPTANETFIRGSLAADLSRSCRYNGWFTSVAPLTARF